MRTNAGIFAARGDAWCTPNFQNDAVYSTHGMKIEGYGPDGVPKKAPERREPAPEPRRGSNPELRIACNRALRIKARKAALMRAYLQG